MPDRHREVSATIAMAEALELRPAKVSTSVVRRLTTNPSATDEDLAVGLVWLYFRVRNVCAAKVVAEAEEADLRECWAAMVAVHGAERVDGLVDWSDERWAAVRRLAEGPKTYTVRASRVLYADLQIEAPGRRAAEAEVEALLVDPNWEPAGGWQGLWGIAGCV
jgi:hypothetical protein